MSVLDAHTNDLHEARRRLVDELREHALVIGHVTLTSGAEAEYYVDAHLLSTRARYKDDVREFEAFLASVHFSDPQK